MKWSCQTAVSQSGNRWLTQGMSEHWSEVVLDQYESIYSASVNGLEHCIKHESKVKGTVKTAIINNRLRISTLRYTKPFEKIKIH